MGPFNPFVTAWLNVPSTICVMPVAEHRHTNLPNSNYDINTEFAQVASICSWYFSYLELHRGVLLILGGCVALVVEMVGSGWVDNGRLLGLPLTALAVHVNHKC